MHDDYTNLSLSAVACIMLMADLAHQKSATSLIYNAEMTAYDLNHCRGSRLRRRLEVWGKRELLVSPELLYEPRRRRQCTKAPKAATHTLLLWEPIRTVLCPWRNQMDREAVLVELRRERNRQRKNNKSRKQHVWGWMEIQYVCLRVNFNTTGDSWPSTLALIDLSVSIQYIKNLLCR